MGKQDYKLFDIIAIKRDHPDRRLFKGLQGTVVEIYRDGEAYEVDFSDEQGRTFALETLGPDDLLLVPTINIEGILRQVNAYLTGAITREELSEWGRGLLQAIYEERAFLRPE